MFQSSRFKMAFRGLAAILLMGLPSAATADVIPANADAFVTLPNVASVTIPGLGSIPLEGAAEPTGYFGVGYVPFGSLTAGQLNTLNGLAPNLASVAYHLAWTTPDQSVVDSTSSTWSDQLSQVLAPNTTTPNFDTVVNRLNSLTFTASGQSQETRIQILMLDLQSVTPVLSGGFHYEVLAVLSGGPVDPQYTGNLTFDSTLLGPTGVTGTLDLGVTGPTPTSGNLGADLPSGMEGLPVDFDIRFIPLDGGPSLPSQSGESIFQNTGHSSFDPVAPEPSTVALLFTAALAAGGSRLLRKRPAK